MESTVAAVHRRDLLQTASNGAPETVKPLKQIMLEQEKKKKEQKKAKEERRKLRDENTDVSATDIID